MFSDDDVKVGMKASGPFAAPAPVVRAIMECAANVLGARGGTMTAEEMDAARYAVSSGDSAEADFTDHWGAKVFEHISAQGARVAALERKVADAVDALDGIDAGGLAPDDLAGRAQRLKSFLRRAEERVAALEKEREDYRNRMDLAQEGEAERDRAMHEAQDRVESLEKERDEWCRKATTAQHEWRKAGEDRDAALQQVEALGRNFEEACQKAEALREQLEAEREANRELVRRAQSAETEVAKRKADCALTEADLKDSKVDLVRERETILRLRTEVADLREQQRDSARRIATLAAAGEVLSEHADKTAGGLLTPEEVAQNERVDTGAEQKP